MTTPTARDNSDSYWLCLRCERVVDGLVCLTDRGSLGRCGLTRADCYQPPPPISYNEPEKPPNQPAY